MQRRERKEVLGHLSLRNVFNRWLDLMRGLLSRGGSSARKNEANTSVGLRRRTRDECFAGAPASRRALALGMTTFTFWPTVWVSPSTAGVLDNFVRASQSEDISATQATVRLLDAYSTLRQIQVRIFRLADGMCAKIRQI
jgi:hypothetical protein